MSKTCIPHLLKSTNPHILTLSPPLYMNKRFFGLNLAYTISKYGMTLAMHGLSEEFAGEIGANCLWPRTLISTAAVEFEVADAQTLRRCRKDEIMADAAYNIVTSDFKKVSANYFIDDEVLPGVDLSKYNVDPSVPQNELATDTLID